jgi:hypothetical protein
MPRGLGHLFLQRSLPVQDHRKRLRALRSSRSGHQKAFAVGARVPEYEAWRKLELRLRHARLEDAGCVDVHRLGPAVLGQIEISLPSRHPRGEPPPPSRPSVSPMRPDRCWRASRTVDRTVARRPRARVRSRRANDERTELRSGGPHGICALPGISPGGLQAAEFVQIEGVYGEAEQPRAPTQKRADPTAEGCRSDTSKVVIASRFRNWRRLR